MRLCKICSKEINEGYHEFCQCKCHGEQEMSEVQEEIERLKFRISKLEKENK